MKHKLILASASPRRRELLSMLGWDFKVEVSNADENIDKTLQPDLFTQELALLKAADVAKKHANEKNTLVIGADTIVYLDGEILGKPKDNTDAKRMLTAMSGKEHFVYSGICVIDTSTAKAECRCVKTAVKFCTLSERQIDDYVSTGEPLDKAGAYGIQGKAAVLVEGINGDYFNVVGLPLATLNELIVNEFN